MSTSGGDVRGAERAALEALEEAVIRAARELRALSRRVSEAEDLATRLREQVGRIGGDPAQAERLLGRLGALDAENEDLRARIEEGRAGVERILARVRFLEEGQR